MSVRSACPRIVARITPAALSLLARDDEPGIATVRRHRLMLEELARVKASCDEIDGHIVTIEEADLTR